MAKKSTSSIMWFAVGAVAMYFLKDTVSGFVNQAKGAVGMRGRSLPYRYY